MVPGFGRIFILEYRWRFFMGWDESLLTKINTKKRYFFDFYSQQLKSVSLKWYSGSILRR